MDIRSLPRWLGQPSALGCPTGIVNAGPVCRQISILQHNIGRHVRRKIYFNSLFSFKNFNDLFLFYVHWCFICTSIYWMPWNWVTDSCELPRGCWELNLGLLEVQEVLFTTETVFSPYMQFLRFHPTIAKCRKRAKEGTLGAPSLLQGHSSNDPRPTHQVLAPKVSTFQKYHPGWVWSL
jgi:hypothetical protein